MKISIRQLMKATVVIGLFYGVSTAFLPMIPIIYLCDFLIVCALMMALLKPKKNSQRIKPLWIFIILFFLMGTFSFIWNGGNALHYLWGFRNYFRFFIFFFLCILFLHKEDGDWCLNIIEKSFRLHIIMTIIQFSLGYRQDLLGGMFGITAGSNGGLNIYLIGMLCLLLQKYQNSKIKLSKIMGYIFFMCLNAAVAELKFFYVELIIVALMYFLVSSASWKTIKVVLSIIPIMIIGINILIYVFPNFTDFFRLASLLEQFSDPNASYASAYDIGRASIFQKLTPIIQNWSQSSNVWIGIGLGNADYSSSFSFLNSAFYNVYENIHYMWFSLGYLFVETGYLGTIFYIMFFVGLFVIGLYRYRIKKINSHLMTCLFSVACLMIGFYNSSLRSNYAYVAFFLLALPFIQSTPEKTC